MITINFKNLSNIKLNILNGYTESLFDDSVVNIENEDLLEKLILIHLLSSNVIFDKNILKLYSDFLIKNEEEYLTSFDDFIETMFMTYYDEAEIFKSNNHSDIISENYQQHLRDQIRVFDYFIKLKIKPYQYDEDDAFETLNITVRYNFGDWIIVN